jgi:hypothetical protein
MTYRELHDGLSDMIEGGRLDEWDIPDDYRWLVEALAELANQNERADTKNVQGLEQSEDSPQRRGPYGMVLPAERKAGNHGLCPRRQDQRPSPGDSDQ